MSTIQTIVAFCYLLAAVGFVVGLHLMNSPATARRGSQVSATGMALAVAATVVIVVHEGTITTAGWVVLAAGTLVGALIGLGAADRVRMTAIPQLVSLFNAAGGGAAALIAIAEFVRLTSDIHGTIGSRTAVAMVLDVAFGALTFSGSLVAAGKLQGWVTGNPVVFPGARVLNTALALVTIAGGAYLIFGSDSAVVFAVVTAAALILGVTTVMPIGGADMPVVISLLNALTGTAVAMAGFVIDNSALIIAGALVGASGGILTKLMADAMNRSIVSIVMGGFGTGDSGSGGPAGPDGSVHQLSADGVAAQLVSADKVIIVPGFGLAAARAQHAVRALADLLEARGVEVSFAIHPVAGRMPGHMNVLLAEADVPYDMLKPMEEINAEFPRTDVALVIGANDVVNPAARRPGNPISGMPILDVDQAKSVVVIKRSMGRGYAGLDNELYVDPKTSMFFADAKAGLDEILAAADALVGAW